MLRRYWISRTDETTTRTMSKATVPAPAAVATGWVSLLLLVDSLLTIAGSVEFMTVEVPVGCLGGLVARVVRPTNEEN